VETGGPLNIRVNNHRHFCTINKPDAPVSLHIESHNTNLDLSFLATIIHILPIQPTPQHAVCGRGPLFKVWARKSILDLTFNSSNPFSLHFQHFSFHNTIQYLHTVQLSIVPRAIQQSTILQTMLRPLRVVTVVLVFCSIHACSSLFFYSKFTVILPKYAKNYLNINLVYMCSFIFLLNE